MKLLSSLICAALLMILGAATEAKAIYYVGNSTSTAVTSTITIQTSTCGTYTVPGIAANTIVPVSIPAGCTVISVTYQSVTYPTGGYYNLPTPPPAKLAVTIARTVFTN